MLRFAYKTRSCKNHDTIKISQRIANKINISYEHYYESVAGNSDYQQMSPSEEISQLKF